MVSTESKNNHCVVPKTILCAIFTTAYFFNIRIFPCAVLGVIWPAMPGTVSCVGLGLLWVVVLVTVTLTEMAVERWLSRDGWPEMAGTMAGQRWPGNDGWREITAERWLDRDGWREMAGHRWFGRDGCTE